MAVSETLIQGIDEVLKQRLQDITSRYMPRVNEFYQKSSKIMAKANIDSLNSLNSINSSIFEQMKQTQIKSEDLKISNNLQLARDRFYDSNNQKYLEELNSLLGEGYSILTELGEELRGQEIKYLITYNSSGNNQVLTQRVIGLKDFVSTFSLSAGGKIFLSGINNFGQEENSFINKKQWRRLLFFQKIKQQERINNLDNTELENFIDLYRINGNKDMIREIIKDKKIRSKIYKGVNEKISTKNIVQNIMNAVELSYNAGRLIELGAGLIGQKKGFNLKNMEELYDEDTIAFYKKGDFMLNGIEYQSKLDNATVNLSTIINGMQQLTNYFSNFYNDTSQISSQASQDGKEAENKVYALLEKELLSMFTV